MAEKRHARLVALAAAGAGEDRRVDVVCSTAGVNDRNARIEPGAWDLTRYLANPIVLYAHAKEPDALDNVRPEDTLPIGRAENVRVENGNLLATVVFATAEQNPFAEKVYQLFKGGFLNAISVGFLPKSVRFEMVDGREIAVLSQCELYELSVVPLPSDPGAVAMRNASALRTFAAGVAASGGKTMNPAILIALGLAAGLSEGDAVAEITKLRALVALAGAKTADAAAGVLQAWKAAADELPGVRAKLEALSATAEKTERDTIVAKLEIEKKISPAMKEWALAAPLDALRAFAAVAAPIGALATAPSTTPASGGAQKTWEQMSNMERHALYQSDPAAFQALSADYETRRASARKGVK